MHPLIRLIKQRGLSGMDLRADLIAGITTAILLVPQAMAYATLAGLPPVVGLYASTLPLLAYAAIGTSPVMAVGPVALISLMTASALAPFADASAAELVTMAGALAVLVGLIQIVLGLMRLDFLTRLLSRPVLTGFTSAAALLIAFSQLPAMLGVDQFTFAIGSWHLTTLLIGAGAVAALLAFKKLDRRIPAALIVLVAATAAVATLGLDAAGVAVVGSVPAGLPWPSIPLVETSVLIHLLPSAFAIALVGYLESFAVAKALARPHPERINAHSEWKAVGVANLASAAVGGYPIAGGFSRSAVNAGAGAKTRIAGALTALIVLATLALLTPLFTNLPRAALAALVIVAVIGLIHIKDWKRLALRGRVPLTVALITFGATMVLDIEMGLMLGIAAGFVAQRFFAGTTGNVSTSTNVATTETTLHPNETSWCVTPHHCSEFSVKSPSFSCWHDSRK